MTLIVVLLVLGLVLISVEFFIPGGIVGVIGALLMLGAVGVSYAEYGTMVAGWVLLGCLVVGALWVAVMFMLMAKTPYGKKMFLTGASSGRIVYGSREDSAEEDEQADALLGEQGTAVTPMTPTGRIEVKGATYEASSQSGYLERGSKVEIIGRGSFGFVVKKS